MADSNDRVLLISNAVLVCISLMLFGVGIYQGDTPVTIIGGIMLIMAIVTMHFGACNNKTFQQKMVLLRAADRVPFDARRAYLDAISSVTYKQHLWTLFWLRDPMKLYPASVTTLRPMEIENV